MKLVTVQAAAGMKRSRTWAHTLYAGGGTVPTQNPFGQQPVQLAQVESVAVPKLRVSRGTKPHQGQHEQRELSEQQEHPRTMLHSTSHEDLQPCTSMPQVMRFGCLLPRPVLLTADSMSTHQYGPVPGQHLIIASCSCKAEVFTAKARSQLGGSRKVVNQQDATLAHVHSCTSARKQSEAS